MLGSRDLANQVFCARDRRKAVKAAYAGTPITDTRTCDTSPLDANERFAREQGLAGTPVIVRSDGAVIEGLLTGDIDLAERVCGVVERAHGITTTGRKDAP